MAFNVKPYDSYTSQFDGFATDWGEPSSSQYAVNMFKNYATQPEPVEAPQKRSFLDRTFDALLTPAYMSAGFAKGFFDNDEEDNINPFQGAWQGLKAGNPFGGGFDKGEYNYTEVLDSAGWQPTSKAGKFARGAVGFTGDVLLDPTTYLTGGVSALVKGSGKVGKVAQGFDKAFTGIGDDVYEASKKYLDNAGIGQQAGSTLSERYSRKFADETETMFKGATEMTPEMGRRVVMANTASRGKFLPKDQLAKEGERLASRYNRLKGVDRAKPITFGLGNLPFMDKAPGMLGKTFEISDGEWARNIADKLKISSTYANTRDYIYGSKIGKMFAPNSPAYKLAKDDPKKLYDYMQFLDITKGYKMGKQEKEKLYRNKAKYMNLSPAESKAVIDALQDKTIWSKVTETVKFGQTAEAKNLMKNLQEELEGQKRILDELQTKRADYENLKYATDKEYIDASNEANALKEDYLRSVQDVDVDTIRREEDLTQYIDTLEQELSSLKKKTDVESPYSKTVQLYDEVAEQEKKFSEYFKGAEPIREEMKQVKQAMKTASPDEREHLKLLEARLQEKFKQFKMNAPNRDAKLQLIEQIGRDVFDDPNAISKSVGLNDLERIVNGMRRGADKEVLRDNAERMASTLDGKMREVYRAVAETMHYESWFDEYGQELVELGEKSRKEGLTTQESKRYAKLMQKDIQRRDLIHKLEGRDIEEIQEYRSKMEDDRLAKEFGDIEHLANSNSGLNVAEDMQELERRNFNADDASSESYKPADKTKNYMKDTFFDVPVRTLMMRDLIKSSMKTFDGTLNENQAKYINSLAQEAEDIMANKFGRSYDELTDPQRDLLFNMARQSLTGKYTGQGAKSTDGVKAITDEIARRAEGQRTMEVMKSLRPGYEVIFGKENEMWKGTVEDIIRKDGDITYNIIDNQGELVEGVRASDIRKVSEKQKAMTDEEIINNSLLNTTDMKNKKKLESRLKDLQKELDGLPDEVKKQKSDLFNEYYKEMNEYKDRLTKLNSKRVDLDEAMNGEASIPRIQQLQEQVKKLEDAVSSNDALETYLRTNYGDGKVDAFLKKKGDEIAKTVLDHRTDLNDKQKKIIKALRAEFNDIGEKEAQIGKLRQEQVMAMMDKYVPHILTDDGARALAGKKIQVGEDGLPKLVDRPIEPKSDMLTGDYGYGQEFNRFRMSRQFKKIKMGDEWIENPTINQINEYLAPLIKGKNFFSESIADVYLTRMMKHGELMYDHQYMNTMLETFGDDVTNIPKEGYTAVVNFGQIKDRIRRQATEMMKGSNQISFEDAQNQIIEQLGFSRKMLDEEATPMVELNYKQLAKVNNIFPGTAKQVNNAIVQKANQARKVQIAKDKQKFLQMYDKFLHFIKLNQTTVMPAFHLRNKVSNIYLNWLEIGRDAMNPDMQVKALKAVRAKGDPQALKNAGGISIKTPEGKETFMQWDELYRLAERNGAIDEGFFAKDIGAGSQTTGKLGRFGVDKKFDPTDTENFFLYEKGGRFGNAVENTDRLIHFASMLKRGSTVEEAVESSKKFLFDYSDLTPFEQNVMKRIFPYYTWLRKNGALQLDSIVEKPGKLRDVAKGTNAVEATVDEENQLDEGWMAGFAQDWVQTPFRSEDEPILWNPNLPYMDLGRLPDPTKPRESARESMSMVTPQIKVPIEQALNKNFFFNDKITDEEGASSVFSGQALKDRADHIGRQLAMYNAGEGVKSKDGLDKNLHLLNMFSGQKFLSYDDNAFKGMMMEKIRERLEEKEKEE